jgi:NACalpha-BTF3-like transcription factor
MDEMYQFQNEMEQRLEKALDNIEFSTDISADDIDVIRAACGKPRNSHVNPVLRDVINDFGAIFGGAK